MLRTARESHKGRVQKNLLEKTNWFKAGKRIRELEKQTQMMKTMKNYQRVGKRKTIRREELPTMKKSKVSKKKPPTLNPRQSECTARVAQSKRKSTRNIKQEVSYS